MNNFKETKEIKNQPNWKNFNLNLILAGNIIYQCSNIGFLVNTLKKPIFIFKTLFTWVQTNLPTLEFFTCATHLQRTVQILLLNRGVNTCPYKFFVSVSTGKAFFIKGAYY